MLLFILIIYSIISLVHGCRGTSHLYLLSVFFLHQVFVSIFSRAFRVEWFTATALYVLQSTCLYSSLLLCLYLVVYGHRGGFGSREFDSCENQNLYSYSGFRSGKRENMSK